MLPREVVIPAESRCAVPSAAAVEWREAHAAALDTLVVVPFTHETMYDNSGLESRVQSRIRPSAAVVGFPVPTGVAWWDETFVEPGRAFVYDNALAAIAYAQAGRGTRAESLLHTLEGIQRPDGAWGFSFSTRADNYYDREYVRAGVVAWAAYAMVYYAWVTGDRQFLPAAERASAYLLQSRVPVTAADERAGLIMGGQGQWTEDDAVFVADFRPDVAVVEHQIDAWFLFALLDHLNPGGDWGAARDQLARSVERAAWRPEVGGFAVGVSQAGPVNEDALDATGAWAALWLGARGNTDQALRVMTTVERMFAVSTTDLVGYRPYAGPVADYRSIDWDTSRLIFVEGSLGAALAHLRYGDAVRGEQVLASASRLQCMFGGRLPYATRLERHFPTVASAAATVWYALVVAEVRLGTQHPVWGRLNAR